MKSKETNKQEQRKNYNNNCNKQGRLEIDTQKEIRKRIEAFNNKHMLLYGDKCIKNYNLGIEDISIIHKGDAICRHYIYLKINQLNLRHVPVLDLTSFIPGHSEKDRISNNINKEENYMYVKFIFPPYLLNDLIDDYDYVNNNIKSRVIIYTDDTTGYYERFETDGYENKQYRRINEGYIVQEVDIEDNPFFKPQLEDMFTYGKNRLTEARLKSLETIHMYIYELANNDYDLSELDFKYNYNYPEGSNDKFTIDLGKNEVVNRIILRITLRIWRKGKDEIIKLLMQNSGYIRNTNVINENTRASRYRTAEDKERLTVAITELFTQELEQQTGRYGEYNSNCLESSIPGLNEALRHYIEFRRDDTYKIIEQCIELNIGIRDVLCDIGKINYNNYEINMEYSLNMKYRLKLMEILEFRNEMNMENPSNKEELMDLADKLKYNKLEAGLKQDKIALGVLSGFDYECGYKYCEPDWHAKYEYYEPDWRDAIDKARRIYQSNYIGYNYLNTRENITQLTVIVKDQIMDSIQNIKEIIENIYKVRGTKCKEIEDIINKLNKLLNKVEEYKLLQRVVGLSTKYLDYVDQYVQL